jgi:RTX calcium-binding nonapeptide repeat (4 copies)
VIGLVSIAVSPRAFARPLGYESVDCDIDGTPVCTWVDSIDRWECDLDALGGAGTATAWMIYGERTDLATDCGNICDGDLYCSFGIRDGQKYYCDLTQAEGEDLKEGLLQGTEDNDGLSFWYEEGTVKCGMMNHQIDLTAIPVVRGRMVGGPGGDAMHGSWVSDGNYEDLLYGGGGDDYIYGHEGADQCFGGDGYDRIHAGAGDDTIEGGDTADYLSGGPGDDTMSGGGWSDFMCGNEDVDTMLGGAATDYMTGGAGADILDGGALQSWCTTEPGNTHVNCTEWDAAVDVCPVDVLPY